VKANDVLFVGLLVGVSLGALLVKTVLCEREYA